MRKKERQQGKANQLLLFKREEVSYRPEVSRSIGTTEEQGESLHFSLLARNRALTVDILERIMSISNLKKAYERVRVNKGKSGVDKMSINELSEWLGKHIGNHQKSVIEEKYEPDLVLGVAIPKPNGGTRLLGIPTVKDRLLQQVINQILMNYYDPLFSESSYGFRPNRGALEAVSKSSEYIKLGNEWVVDIDLKSFFDKINHDRLMQRLSKGIGDKRLLRLIRKFLKTGMMQGGLETQRISGTPQGGPLSPLLSNIVLDELDKELESRGHIFIRYADDCNIYVKSKRAGERVLKSITEFIEKRLKLEVNEEKSGVRHCSKVKFLGYTIMPKGKMRIADKSITRFKEKIREKTKRNRGVSFAQIIEEINQATRGWVNYFQLANTWLPWRSLDGWLRRKLRCYRLKQCGRKYTIYKFLRKLGVTRNKAWNAILYGGQWWSLATKQTCQKAMNDEWFAEQGFYTLTNLHKRFKC
jgi:RNA-directed DNA polymerase